MTNSTTRSLLKVQTIAKKHAAQIRFCYIGEEETSEYAKSIYHAIRTQRIGPEGWILDSSLRSNGSSKSVWWLVEHNGQIWFVERPDAYEDWADIVSRCKHTPQLFI